MSYEGFVFWPKMTQAAQPQVYPLIPQNDPSNASVPGSMEVISEQPAIVAEKSPTTGNSFKHVIY